MNQILKSILLPLIMVAFYPEASWLNELRNFDAFVDNEKLKLNEAGADPGVFNERLIAPPYDVAQRVDTGMEVLMDSYRTEATLVTDLEELETNYAKQQSVAEQHRSAMYNHVALVAAYSIAPISNTAKTPVMPTTGVETDHGLSMTYKDILNLKLSFDKQNIPVNERVLLLSPEHQADLLAEDADRFNQVMTTSMLAGFKVYMFNGIPLYSAEGVKTAFGAVSGQVASIAFCKLEAYRSKNNGKLLIEESPVTYGGNLLSFVLRFKSGAVRGKGVAAIYSGIVEPVTTEPETTEPEATEPETTEPETTEP